LVRFNERGAGEAQVPVSVGKESGGGDRVGFLGGGA